MYNRESFQERVQQDVEAEPSELDKPEGDVYEDEDDFEADPLGLAASGAADEDEADDEDLEEDRASPLAEDAPIRQRPAVKHKPLVENGGSDVSMMSQNDRRREFPSVPPARAIRRKIAPRKPASSTRVRSPR
jgi:hypothetical protein